MIFFGFFFFHFNFGLIKEKKYMEELCTEVDEIGQSFSPFLHPFTRSYQWILWRNE